MRKMILEFNDYMEFSQRTVTPEGYLVAPANIARTGIQTYRASELKLDKEMGLVSDALVRLYRPPEEVFDPESMSTFDGQPVIMEPHRPVTAENWRDLAVGDIAGPTRNGDLLSVGRITIRDKGAVAAIQAGKKFLSSGYRSEVDLTPGTTATGEAYDGIMRNIRGNHVAIVSNPRGGSACRIADSNEGEKRMKKLTINGVPVEVGDAEASIIESLMADLATARATQPSVTLAVGNVSKPIVGDAAILKEITDRDSEITRLTALVPTDAQLAAMVQARTAVIGDALKLVPDFKAEGKNDTAIQREVLSSVLEKDEATKLIVGAVLGGQTIGDAEPLMIATAFRAVVAMKPKTATVSTTAGDTALSAALVGDGKTPVVVSDKLVGRDAFIAHQNEAWQVKK